MGQRTDACCRARLLVNDFVRRPRFRNAQGLLDLEVSLEPERNGLEPERNGTCGTWRARDKNWR